MSGRTLGAGRFVGDFEPGSVLWSRARRGRLGGSEIAAVVGLSRWQSAFSLWHLKAGTGRAEPDTAAMEWGRDLEAVIARRFARAHTCDGWRVSRCGIYANRDRPWQIAQPDRVVHLGARKLATLEIKTDRYADEWGAPGTDDIPVSYRCQVLWQLDTFGWDRCYVAVLITGVDYREYVVDYDPADVTVLRDAAAAFLESLRCGQPPPIDGHPATYRAVRALHPDIHDTDIELDPELAARYLQAVAGAATAGDEKTAAAAQVLAAMGQARRAMCGGDRIATRSPTKDGPPHLRPAHTRRCMT